MKTGDTTALQLSPSAQSALIPLAIRAEESELPAGLLKDAQAIRISHMLGIDREKLLEKVDAEGRVMVIQRSLKIDGTTRRFLERFPGATVVHIGCGLDSRFERVDDGRVEWYDLDLAEVVALRRQLVASPTDRYHLLAKSVLAEEWLTCVPCKAGSRTLFLAEGVLMYFEAGAVRSLVLAMQQAFPGSELVFDAFSPFFNWANNLRVDRTGVGDRSHWGLRRGKEIEDWGPGIRLLDEWFPFLQFEPRLPRMRWVRWLPLLTHAVGVYQFLLE